MKWALALGLVLLPSVARADEPEPVVAKVHVQVEAGDDEIRVVGAGYDGSCSTTCELDLVPGVYDVKTTVTSQKITLDRPSRVRLVRGSKPLQTAGTVALVAGAAVVVAAVLIPLFYCRSGSDTVGPQGDIRPATNKCSDLSDGLKIGWIAGGGIGLTVALVGGVSLVFTGPHFAVDDLKSARVGVGLRF